MSKEKHITNVYVWQNGMVMTFDQYGQQMPEYQGRKEEVLSKIKEVYSGHIHGESNPLKWRHLNEQ